MGRLGNFFKKAWTGLKNFGRKAIKVLPQIIDTGKTIVDAISKNPNTPTKTSGEPSASHAFQQGTDFARKALDKADQLVKAQQAGGTKGVLKAGLDMLKTRG